MRIQHYSQLIKLASTVVAIGTAALGAASGASANPISSYASPTGSGSACTQIEPCSIVTALKSASSGVTVILTGDEGTYGSPQNPISETLELKNRTTLEGAAGQARPEIYSAAKVAVEAVPGGEEQRITDVDIQDSAKSSTALVGAGSINRVIANSPSGIGCSSEPVTSIIDSICSGEYGINDQVLGIGLWTLDLRNDTIYAGREAVHLSSSGPGMQITAVNTIVRGGGMDIGASQQGGTVAMTLEHSNYATVSAEGGATVTAAGSSTNQIAPPLFISASEGNLHEASGSPTIDAGVNSPLNGEIDLDGDPRTQPGQLPCNSSEPTAITDIGAYELAPVVLPCPPPPPMPPNTSILRAKIHPRGATFSFSGRGGAVLSFECELDEQPFQNCQSPKSYKHLKPGHYAFSVRAVDQHGFDLTPARRWFKIRRRK